MDSMSPHKRTYYFFCLIIIPVFIHMDKTIKRLNGKTCNRFHFLSFNRS